MLCARPCLEDWGLIQNFRDGIFSLVDAPERGWTKFERDQMGHYIIDLLGDFPDRVDRVRKQDNVDTIGSELDGKLVFSFEDLSLIHI